VGEGRHLIRIAIHLVADCFPRGTAEDDVRLDVGSMLAQDFEEAHTIVRAGGA
jgi:hypothetical protein